MPTHLDCSASFLYLSLPSMYRKQFLNQKLVSQPEDWRNSSWEWGMKEEIRVGHQPLWKHGLVWYVCLRNCAEGTMVKKNKWPCNGLASCGSSAVTNAQLEAKAQVRKLEEEWRLEKDTQLSTILLALGVIDKKWESRISWRL